MWHNHQPLYCPEWNGSGSQTDRVQYAQDGFDAVKSPTKAGQIEGSIDLAAAQQG